MAKDEELHEWEDPDESDMDDSDSTDTDPCPSCGKPVWTEADWCPHCGQNITTATESGALPAWVWLVATVLLVAILIGWLMLV